MGEVIRAVNYATARDLRVAVVGAGVAGLTAALLLRERHRVTLFEQNDYVGGHTNTIAIPEGPDAGTPVDTGFIVLNDKTYPLFNRLLSRLSVSTRWSDMSFSYFDERTGLQYAGTGVSGLFAQRRNLFRPSYWRFLREIVRFCHTARRELAENKLAGLTVAQFLDRGGFGREVRETYIYPMASAIWSSSLKEIETFPAEMMIRFWENHGLLSLEDRPRWMTVVGGSQSYVRKALDLLKGNYHVNARVERIERPSDSVRLKVKGSDWLTFDAVVIAAHADETLSTLADPSEDERRLLGAWRYSRNRTVLHSDESVMPPSRRAWASWNYRRHAHLDAQNPVTVTYHMNRLQGLKTSRQYFVTLNYPSPLPPERIIREIVYTHPLYTFEALASQRELPRLNGLRRTFFCGSYFGYGFHEDAVRSAVNVGRIFGIEL